MAVVRSNESTNRMPEPEVKTHHDMESESHFAPLIDAALERRILRKIYLHLMIPLWIIFAFGFLDRINLGNVAVLGIVPVLKHGTNGLDIALQVFFVPYILLDIPSNIVLKTVRPSTWINVLTFLWGAACMCQGFVENEGGLIACRFFLGVFEAGFVPGSAYLMSMYYKRHDFQKRFSLFWVAGLVAGAFGGLLAYALVHMSGLSSYSGWRWIFIMEGLLSIAIALPANFLITDWPEEAIYIGITVSGYATALFIPSIVVSLGCSGIQSQVHSIPIWIVAAVVTLGTSVLTDRLKHRDGFIMFGVVFSSIGYIILLCQGPIKGGLNLHVRYMAVFFVTTGCYIVQPVAIVWMANNLSGHYKRAIGLAIQVGVGNIGGIIASNIFVVAEAPRYIVRYGVSLAMMLFCGLMSTVLAIGLMIENKMCAEGKRDYRLQLDESILNNMGDDDPRFRFSL